MAQRTVIAVVAIALFASGCAATYRTSIKRVYIEPATLAGLASAPTIDVGGEPHRMVESRDGARVAVPLDAPLVVLTAKRRLRFRDPLAVRVDGGHLRFHRRDIDAELALDRVTWIFFEETTRTRVATAGGRTARAVLLVLALVAGTSASTLVYLDCCAYIDRS